MVMCPQVLGEGVRTKRQFCDVLIGRDPAGGILVTLPPHTGPVTLSFDLHNRHTYSEELVKANRAYSRYTATIGVLTLDNTLVSRAIVQNEFRTQADLVDRITRRQRRGRPQGGGADRHRARVDRHSRGGDAGQHPRREAVGRASRQRRTRSAPSGRPMAIISNVMVEYRAAPPRPRAVPPARRPAAPQASSGLAQRSLPKPSESGTNERPMRSAAPSKGPCSPGPALETAVQDVRYALRTLRSSPGFTAVAVTMLALGIGANTAIFSVVSAVLLRPLPFPEPDRLVLVWENFSAVGGPARVEVSPGDYVSWSERNRSFTGVAGFAVDNYNLTGAGDPDKITGARITGNLFFDVLGMQPLLGRTLTERDDQPGAGPVVVIDERVWRSRFAADPAVCRDAPIRLNGLPHTVVGVVPADFRFPNTTASLWVPAQVHAGRARDCARATSCTSWRV